MIEREIDWLAAHNALDERNGKLTQRRLPGARTEARAVHPHPTGDGNPRAHPLWLARKAANLAASAHHPRHAAEVTTRRTWANRTGGKRRYSALLAVCVPQSPFKTGGRLSSQELPPPSPKNAAFG